METQKNALFPFAIEQLESFIAGVVERGVEKGVSAALASQQKAPEEYLTKRETAQLYRVSEQTIGDKLKKQELVGHRLGGRLLIKRSDVEAALISTDRYQRTGRKTGPKPKAQ